MKMTIIDYFKTLIKEGKTDHCISELRSSVEYVTEEFYQRIAYLAAKYGNLELVKVIEELIENREVEDSIVEGAFKGRQFHILDHILTDAMACKDEDLSTIIWNNDIEMLKYLFSRGCSSPNAVTRISRDKDMIMMMIDGLKIKDAIVKANNFDEIISRPELDSEIVDLIRKLMTPK